MGGWSFVRLNFEGVGGPVIIEVRRVDGWRERLWERCFRR